MLAAFLRTVSAQSVALHRLSLADLARDVSATDTRIVDNHNATFLGDSVLLQRAINELISNAEQYGSGVSQIEFTADRSAVSITVTDHDQSFCDANFERACKLFQRLSRRPDVSNPGVGLTFAATVAWAHRRTLKCIAPGSLRLSFPPQPEAES